MTNRKTGAKIDTYRTPNGARQINRPKMGRKLVFMNTPKIEKMREYLTGEKPRSAWARGVLAYAHDLLDRYAEACEWYGHEAANIAEAEKWTLNGARDWQQFSDGGSSLCYNGQIAERLCAPWELRKTRGGALNPNARENWIDCQARALWQAWLVIRQAWSATREIGEEG